MHLNRRRPPTRLVILEMDERKSRKINPPRGARFLWHARTQDSHTVKQANQPVRIQVPIASSMDGWNNGEHLIAGSKPSHQKHATFFRTQELKCKQAWHQTILQSTSQQASQKGNLDWFLPHLFFLRSLTPSLLHNMILSGFILYTRTWVPPPTTRQTEDLRSESFVAV